MYQLHKSLTPGWQRFLAHRQQAMQSQSFALKARMKVLLHHRSNPSRNRMLRLAAALTVAAATLLATASAGARSRQQSQPVPTSRVTVTGTALHTVPQSFLGLSMNVEEMEDYTRQPDFPQFISLITPNGDGPFVLRVGGTYADSAYWNGETSQIMPQYIAPVYDQVTLNDAWLQSLARAVSTTGSKVILNVNAAAHDPQMALTWSRRRSGTCPREASARWRSATSRTSIRSATTASAGPTQPGSGISTPSATTRCSSMYAHLFQPTPALADSRRPGVVGAHRSVADRPALR